MRESTAQLWAAQECPEYLEYNVKDQKESWSLSKSLIF